MHLINNNFKVCFMGVGATGEQVSNHVRPLFDDLVRQYERYEPPSGFPAKGKWSLSVICTSREKTAFEIRRPGLKNARLTFLFGSQTDSDFADTRAEILANMDPHSFLFTLSMDDATVTRPVSINECVIHVQGPNPMDDVALFVRDFTAWKIFPKTVACDWSDIRACLMGQEKSLATYRSRVCDQGFGEFLNGLRLRDSSVLLLVASNGKRTTIMEDIFTPLEMIQAHVKGDSPMKGDTPMIFLETFIENDDGFRSSILA